jgi:hypothetical protein
VGCFYIGKEKVVWFPKLGKMVGCLLLVLLIKSITKHSFFFFSLKKKKEANVQYDEQRVIVFINSFLGLLG